MKKDWNKACKELAKIAGNRPSKLEMGQWPTGMSDSDYAKVMYTAYIDWIGHSDLKPTAMEAVIDIKHKIENNR